LYIDHVTTTTATTTAGPMNATSFNPTALVDRYADEFDELVADGYGTNEAVYMLREAHKDD